MFKASVRHALSISVVCWVIASQIIVASPMSVRNVVHAAPPLEHPVSSNAHLQEEHQVTVANWSFEIEAAVRAPTFAEVIHLGVLDDGRHWLVVSMRATNTSSEEQRIHSDDIQLNDGDGFIKQTGKESQEAAAEIEFESIGGTLSHSVDANDTLDILQVFKVDPSGSDFTLVFDFAGQWTADLEPMILEADGNPRALIGESVNGDRPSASDGQQDDPWTVTTPNFELTLIGATSSPTFAGPFHLGTLDDGRWWLVVTYQIRNTTEEQYKHNSESVQVISAGEEIKQAGEETRSVASELDLIAPSTDLDAGEEATLVQVYKIGPEAEDNSLKMSAGGSWFVSLRPLTELANGQAEAIVPGNAADLAILVVEEGEVNAAPTAIPTAMPTPEPTSIPWQTPTPLPTIESVAATIDRPAGIGETVEVDDFAIRIVDISTFFDRVYNRVGGHSDYLSVMISVEVTSLSEWNNWEDRLLVEDFVVHDPITGAMHTAFDPRFSSDDPPFVIEDQAYPSRLQNQSLGHGDQIFGQIELPGNLLPYPMNESAEVFLIFTTSSDGETGYWRFDAPPPNPI